MEIEYEEPAQYTEEEMKTWMDDQIHDMLLQYYMPKEVVEAVEYE